MKTNQSLEPMTEKILDYVYGELPPEEADKVRARVASDPEWKAEYDLLAGVSRTLDAWDEAPAPADAREAVLRRIRETRPAAAAAGAWLRMAWERLGPVAAAAAVSVAILWATTGSVGPPAAPVKDLLFCGVLWGGIYHMVFLVLLKREPARVWVPAGSGGYICVELRRAVFWAVIAFVLFLGVALATPNPAPFETRTAYRGIAERIPYPVSFLLPAGYALVGCLAAGLFLGRRARIGAGTQGILMGVIAGILIALDLYTYHITYAPFGQSTLAHLAAWTVSGFAVAVASGYGGALLGAKTATRSR